MFPWRQQPSTYVYFQRVEEILTAFIKESFRPWEIWQKNFSVYHQIVVSRSREGLTTLFGCIFAHINICCSSKNLHNFCKASLMQAFRSLGGEVANLRLMLNRLGDTKMILQICKQCIRHLYESYKNLLKSILNRRWH